MADPIAQQPPEALLPKVIRKYQNPQWNDVPTTALGPLVQMDVDRARRGLSPLNKSDTAMAANAASTLQDQIQQPEPGFFGKVLNDLEGTVQSIPHLPGALLNEFEQLPNAPGQIAQGLADMSPKEIFSAPGARMIPGSYVLGHGLEAFQEHPLLAALDVAPAVKFGAGFIPEEALQAVKSPLLNMADRFGLGPMSQETSRMIAQANRGVTRTFSQYAKQTAELMNGLSDEEVTNLTGVMQRGDQAEIAALPPNQRAVVDKTRELTTALSQKGVDAGLLGQFDGEFYPTAQANKLQDLRQKYWDAMADGKTDKANKMLEKFSSFNSQNPPLRFQNLVDQEMEQKVTSLAQSANPNETAEGWQGIQKMIQAKFYDQIPNVTHDDLSTLAQEVTPVWQTLKDAGHDPVFIHSIGAEDVNRLRMPRVLAEREVNPESVRAKTWNMAPGVQNFGVGLNAQALDLVQHQATQAVIEEMKQTYGVTRADLINQYMPIAERLQQTPGVNIGNRVEQLIAKDFVKWDPESPFALQRPDMKPSAGGEEWYLPRPVEKVLRTIYPVQRSELARLWDASMGVFRIGILPLSPRWHINNMIGGAALLAGRTGPSVLTYLNDALSMIKEGKLPEGLSQGMVSVPEDVRAWNYESGRQMASLLQEKGMKATTLDAMSKVGGPLNKVIQKSFQLNEFVDDLYRSMAYLYGKDKALTKGMTAVEAETAGIKLSNKILQDWDAMTPVERQVMRSIFPFYGWAKHIMSYVMTYPWDHPWRTSILANFAANELNDWKSGVPQDFQNYLFFGSPDKFGNQTAVNVRGMNPFADVANYFTLAGFVSQLNPAANGLLTAMGFNPRTASASLYPTLTVNPDTGKLEAATKNPITTIAEGFVPQAAGIASLLGMDDHDLQALKLNNPDAYRARLLSSFGVSLPTRDVNKNLAAAQKTLAEKQVLQQAMTNAFKTGDFGSLNKYPQLRPIVQRLNALQKSGALDSLKIQQAGSDKFDWQNVLSSIRGG